MILKPNNRVLTPHGPGTVKLVEGKDDRSRRYAIDLDKNPFDFSPVYYWPNELKHLLTNKSV